MKKYPYLNSSLPSEERAKDLLKRMSLKEKTLEQRKNRANELLWLSF